MKKLLFSVTRSDCKWDYYRGSGAGGQHRNKTSSAVRCTHKDSGAVGTSEDTRSQHRNKTLAFKRMANTKAFKKWHKLEIARQMGTLVNIEDSVDREMQNVKVEVRKDGKWYDD